MKSCVSVKIFVGICRRVEMRMLIEGREWIGRGGRGEGGLAG